jgi:hypothetical protein
VVEPRRGMVEARKGETMIMVALLAITQADYLESLPPADRPYTFLVDVRHVPDEQREQHIAALQFTLASASRQRVIEYCTAQPTGPTCG